MTTSNINAQKRDFNLFTCFKGWKYPWKGPNVCQNGSIGPHKAVREVYTRYIRTPGLPYGSKHRTIICSLQTCTTVTIIKKLKSTQLLGIWTLRNRAFYERMVFNLRTIQVCKARFRRAGINWVPLPPPRFLP